MLIIPIENKPNWQHPPVICLTLVLLNLLIFALYQSGDEQRWRTTSIQYEAQQLLRWEQPVFAQYLLEAELAELAAAPLEDDIDKPYLPPNAKEILSDINTELERLGQQQLIDMLLSDRAFDGFVRSHWQTAKLPVEQLASWQYQRQRIEALRNQDSGIRFGITPAEPQPLNFVSTQFMHGSWDHVIGNMVFLCLFGFTLELALGGLPFLALYLLSGVAASAFYVGINWGSYTPAVGASGAVSGLMGMYLALYRLQKIRFFYNFAFYFGELKAPALVILPLWIGKELYGYFFTDTNVAYWAHIGGLISGALLLQAVRGRLVKVDTEKLIDREQHQNDAIGPQLAQIKRAIGELNMKEAQRLSLQLSKAQADYPLVWQTAFDLFKRDLNNKAFHQLTFNLLKHSCQSLNTLKEKSDKKDEWNNLLNNTLEEYLQLAKSPLALNVGLSTLLAQTLLSNGKFKQAGEMANRALTNGGQSGALRALLIKLIQHHNKRQQTEQAQHFSRQLKALPQQA